MALRDRARHSHSQQHDMDAGAQKPDAPGACWQTGRAESVQSVSAVHGVEQMHVWAGPPIGQHWQLRPAPPQVPEVPPLHTGPASTSPASATPASPTPWSEAGASTVGASAVPPSTDGAASAGPASCAPPSSVVEDPPHPATDPANASRTIHVGSDECISPAGYRRGSGASNGSTADEGSVPARSRSPSGRCPSADREVPGAEAAADGDGRRTESGILGM